mmetsp:Transcript_41220/g.99981  ORF Transcript_41220/g.99981 Transcript_41220/m.99981 type:complete len:322 (+) Transcript_41220:2070-3035(+)
MRLELGQCAAQIVERASLHHLARGEQPRLLKRLRLRVHVEWRDRRTAEHDESTPTVRKLAPIERVARGAGEGANPFCRGLAHGVVHPLAASGEKSDRRLPRGAAGVPSGGCVRRPREVRRAAVDALQEGRLVDDRLEQLAALALGARAVIAAHLVLAQLRPQPLQLEVHLLQRRLLRQHGLRRLVAPAGRLALPRVPRAIARLLAAQSLGTPQGAVRLVALQPHVAPLVELLGAVLLGRGDVLVRQLAQALLDVEAVALLLLRRLVRRGEWRRRHVRPALELREDVRHLVLQVRLALLERAEAACQLALDERGLEKHPLEE